MGAFQIVAFHLWLWAVGTPPTADCPGWCPTSQRQFEMHPAGLYVEKEKPMPLIFEEVKLECGYRIDLLVEDEIVLELKSVETLTDVYLAQILTYMRLGNYNLGLLLNFNVSILKNGIKRVIL